LTASTVTATRRCGAVLPHARDCRDERGFLPGPNQVRGGTGLAGTAAVGRRCPASSRSPGQASSKSPCRPAGRFESFLAALGVPSPARRRPRQL